MIDNRLINKQNIKRLTYSDISSIKKALKRNMHSEVSNKATMVESSSNPLPSMTIYSRSRDKEEISPLPGVESTDATSLASASTVGNSNPITVRIQQTNDELTERLKDPIYNISILNNNIKEEDIYIEIASTSVVQACITGINQVQKLANKAYINLKETEEADVHFQRGKKEYEESLKLTFPLLENISQAITDAFKLTVKTTRTLLTGAFINGLKSS